MEETERRMEFVKIPKQRRIELIEGYCEKCLNLRWTGSYYRCEAYTEFFFLWGDALHESCPARNVSTSQLARECFAEDASRRFLKPGGGEKSDRTHKLFGKDRMKDNRPKLWDGVL